MATQLFILQKTKTGLINLTSIWLVLNTPGPQRGEEVHRGHSTGIGKLKKKEKGLKILGRSEDCRSEAIKVERLNQLLPNISVVLIIISFIHLFDLGPYSNL